MMPMTLPQGMTMFPVFIVLASIAFALYKIIEKAANNGKVTNQSFSKTYIPVSVKDANNKHRTVGHWKAEIFEYPAVEEFKNWSIKDTPPLPYRAFKHTYFFTMGIRSMEWNSWIEVDNEWMKFHNRKLERLEKGDPN